MICVTPGAKASTVNQLRENVRAPAVPDGAEEFKTKENEFQINSAMRSLLAALQTENKVIESDDEKTEKPRRVLLCLGQKRDVVAKTLVDRGIQSLSGANSGAGRRKTA